MIFQPMDPSYCILSSNGCRWPPTKRGHHTSLTKLWRRCRGCGMDGFFVVIVVVVWSWRWCFDITWFEDDSRSFELKVGWVSNVDTSFSWSKRNVSEVWKAATPLLKFANFLRSPRVPPRPLTKRCVISVSTNPDLKAWRISRPRPHTWAPKRLFWGWEIFPSGKSRLVKYYNLPWKMLKPID